MVKLLNQSQMNQNSYSLRKSGSALCVLDGHMVNRPSCFYKQVFNCWHDKNVIGTKSKSDLFHLNYFNENL